METQFKLPKREKLELVARYLRGNWGFFAAALLCAGLGMVFNALTPQIIRITVDSVLGEEEAQLGILSGLIDLGWLKSEPIRALWLAAGAVVVVAVLRGVCTYGQRVNLSKGSEGFVKKIRDDL